jgi:hypothetical protein
LKGKYNLLNVGDVDFPPIKLDEITTVCKECLYFKKWQNLKLTNKAFKRRSEFVSRMKEGAYVSQPHLPRK